MANWFGIGEGDQEEIEEKNISHHETGEDDEIGQIAVDILDNGKDIVILAPIAGIDLDDIDVSLNGSTLTLSGKRKKPEIYSSQHTVVKNSECFWGSFTRNIILPDNLDFDSVKATMENSLLMVHISKLHFSSKQIEVENLDD